jgi:hypothetical protein
MLKTKDWEQIIRNRFMSVEPIRCGQGDSNPKIIAAAPWR